MTRDASYFQAMTDGGSEANDREQELREALSHVERADEYRKRREMRKLKQHLNAAKGLLSRHVYTAGEGDDLRTDGGSEATDSRRPVMREAAEQLRNFAAYKRGDGADSRADHLDELADRLESEPDDVRTDGGADLTDRSAADHARAVVEHAQEANATADHVVYDEDLLDRLKSVLVQEEAREDAGWSA